MEQLVKKLENSLHKGFINKNKPVSTQFKPKLLTNQAHENVLSSLLQQLKICKTFSFSVAFITEGGLATLKTMLYDLEKKGIKGRILTSTFLNFNQPKMFKEILKLRNVEVRLADVKGFHSKGYIFEHVDYYSLIVGSSNLTDSALKANFEWNVFLTSLEEGEVITHFKGQFDEAWDKATPLTDEWVLQYNQNYKQPDFPKNQVASLPTYVTNPLKDSLAIQPNKMQSAALEQLKALRNTGANKGLIISATGTGKTYLSAFDVRNVGPKRMLFIVHREQILKKAMNDYRLILGGHEDDFGILSGTNKNYDVKYLFATVQTLSKKENLALFWQDDFDYVLIDEVHHVGAKTYQSIIDYFTPKFLLGMTATPERTDDYNIYELFDYNIAYEIRLQAALEEEMLCPFHYFGVTDYEQAGEMITETADLRLLASDDRVEHILEKINYYGHSGERLHGLMFCSSVEEAKQLSEALNQKGLRTRALSGSNSQEEREQAVADLKDSTLHYILAVDIFNEGVDIPFLNQIVMLRQTKSSIIFIQQLGRGLRKHDSKDYVTIIDFIGNYKNNYLIPIALSGDQSMNKDNVRRRTVNTDYIQGVSTINFEEIAKKRIFDAITKTNLSTLKILKEAFEEVQKRLGRMPMMIDFIEQNSLDPEVIIDYADNFYNFLLKVKQPVPSLTEYELAILTMLSREVLNGKRLHEIVLVDLLIKEESITKDAYITALKEAGTYINDETIQSVERIFSLDFFVTNDKNKYKQQAIIERKNNEYTFNLDIQQSLQNTYFRSFVKDIIACAFEKSKEYDQTRPLTLFKKYSRRDACRLLNWAKDEASTIYGYKSKHGTCPIFVTYHKKDVEAHLAYGDEFLSPDLFRWFTRPRLTFESKEVKEILNAKESDLHLHLFVKKDDGEGFDFYYLGQTTLDETSAREETMPDKNNQEVSVVTANMVLEQSVQYDIYHYLVEE